MKKGNGHTLPEVTLADVYVTMDSYKVLYDLLNERTKEQSISHKRTPTMQEHIAFVRTIPYAAWYLIVAAGQPRPVGAIYLTRQREIGIFIFKAHHGNGYAAAALEQLRALFPGPMLANINPHNEPSLAFFRKHGGHEIQRTFELP